MKEKNNLLKKNSKTFYFASLFFTQKNLINCNILYDFCRTIDNIADNNEVLENKKKNLLNFRNNFINRDFSDSVIKNMWYLIDKFEISTKIVNDLIDGAESDLKEKVTINSQKELLIYPYRLYV